MKENKLLIAAMILGVIVLIITFYSEYAKNKLERDRINAASQNLQQYNQALASQGSGQGAIGGFLSGLPLIGGLF
jgi:type II secretory pathway pseudopilin PulG